MKKVAVIGSGVSGIVSAYYLSKTYHVDLFEAEQRLGGHTHTVEVIDETGKTTPVDTGFIVFNEKNYVNFIKFLSDVDVPYTDSDMSFSLYCETRPFYFGSDKPKGLFAQYRNLFKPQHYRFLAGVRAFGEQCLKDMAIGIPDGLTLGEYLDKRNIRRDVVIDYVLPMTSAIWSASFEDSLNFPATSFMQFWKNHHLLEIHNHLKWKTIPGGSHQYIKKVIPHISGSVHTQAKATSIQRVENGVKITVNHDSHFYDGVVVATHADTALKLMDDPTPLEKALLGAWAYSKNKTYLHTDPSVMPPSKAAWCSWNVFRPKATDYKNPVSVTYWMNRLQPLKTQTNYFVSLNPAKPIDEAHIIQEMKYTHPIMSQDAIATQSRLPELNQNSPVVFCGSYFGYGFHEDATTAARHAVNALTQTLGEHHE